MSEMGTKETKLVYVKRWRTLVELPAKYADEIVESLRCSAVSAPATNSPSKLAQFYDAELANVTGQLFDALNEIKRLRTEPQAAPSDALAELEQQFMHVLDGWEEDSSSPAAISALQYALGAVRDAAHRSRSQAESDK